jgi:hypothetical protein
MREVNCLTKQGLLWGKLLNGYIGLSSRRT